MQREEDLANQEEQTYEEARQEAKLESAKDMMNEMVKKLALFEAYCGWKEKEVLEEKPIELVPYSSVPPPYYTQRSLWTLVLCLHHHKALEPSFIIQKFVTISVSKDTNYRKSG